MDRLGMGVMFIYTPVFMALAFVLMLGVRQSEPRQAVATIGQAVKAAGTADL